MYVYVHVSKYVCIYKYLSWFRISFTIFAIAVCSISNTVAMLRRKVSYATLY